ncbi:MAG: FkbM family methyltransferase [Bacteroidota bacterium]
MQPQHWHYYEVPSTKVDPGDVIVDCGSAEGFFAFKNLTIAKKIYLIEPLPVFCNSLRKNFSDNENIEILHVALADKKSKGSILLNEISPIASKIIPTENGIGTPVEITTIDSLFFDNNIKIDYLKADLEGFEEPMIQGALKTIKAYKPKIAITAYHIGQDANKLIDIITKEVPEYNYLLKGIEPHEGKAVMLHMWI